MRRILSVLVLLLTVVGVRAQLLWKISGGGLQKPSYVVGTYHLAPVSFADSIPGLSAALAEVEQVYGELDMSELADPQKVMALQQAMFLPEGETLNGLLSEDELGRLNATLTELLGVDLTNPAIAMQLGRLSPSALQQQLSLVMFIQKHPGFDPANPFDGYFQRKALEEGKPVGGLETVDFQVKVLFGGTSTDRQVEQLMCFVDNREQNEKDMNLVLEGFFGQDLKKIQAAMDAKHGTSCDATPEEEEALIYGRNADWAKRLPAIMKKKSTFLAVGAAHLPGDRGLLELLRQAGFTVEAVK